MTNVLTRFPLPLCQTLGSSMAGARVSDRQLVDRFIARNGHSAESAFVELVRRHGPLVAGVCRNILRNPQDAEDAFQATFVILARKASSLQRPDRLSFWLYGVATRVAKKARSQNVRRGRRELQVSTLNEIEPIGDWGRHDLQLGGSEEIATLHEEIARLPEKYRLPVVLCDLEGLTHAEASRSLDWPSGSLSVRLMRARKLLHDRLTRRGLAPSSAILAAAALVDLAPAAARPAMAEGTARAILRDLRGHGSTMGRGSASAGSPAGLVLSALTQTKLILLSTAVSLSLITLVFVLIALNPKGRGEFSVDHPPLQAAGARPKEPETDKPGPPPGAAVVGKNVHQAENGGVRAGGDRVRFTPEAMTQTRSHEVLAGGALANYEVLVKRAARDAISQVRLALWCEANGLVAERLKHLALAVLIDPDQPAARGLLGQVSFRGRWRRPEDIGSQLRGDSRFTMTQAAYEDRRTGMEHTADAHWKLALWCERNGLTSEATAHVVAVTRLDPARDAAWRRLGYQKSRGRWMSPEQIASVESMIKARKSADQYWAPRLAKWKSALQEDSKRPRAEAELSRITDPFAAQPVWTTFARDGARGQTIAAQLLGQIEGRDASLGLAFLAAFGDSPEVRRIATEVLARRDPRDVVGPLVNLLIKPVKYEVRPVEWQGSPGILFVEGEQFNLRRLYTVPPLPADTIRRMLDPTTPPDSTLPIAGALGEVWARLASLPIAGQVVRNNVRDVRINLAVSARATLTAQQQLENDTNFIKEHNSKIEESNQRIEAPLRVLTGQDFGHDPESWLAWWTDAQGYAYTPLRSTTTPKPTVDQVIPLPYVPQYQQMTGSTQFRQSTGSSCFGSGTPVWTRQGQRAIDAIRIGDVVLTQESKTGALSFAPVLAVFHNKPAPTLQIRLDDGHEPVVVTGIHRFWLAGKGWVMGRDLKPGDLIRTLGGQARVTAISRGSVQPVFNLEVGEHKSFFAGQAGALVHDNSLVEPVSHPFDQRDDLLVSRSDRH